MSPCVRVLVSPCPPPVRSVLAVDVRVTEGDAMQVTKGDANGGGGCMMGECGSAFTFRRPAQ